MPILLEHVPFVFFAKRFIFVGMNTKEQFVITISREIGSGGRTIGRKLAERLGVRFCDKELIHTLTEQFDLSDNEIEELKSKKKNWLTDFIEKIAPAPRADVIMNGDSIYARDYRSSVTTDDILKAERNILYELAEESSCVIAGRSGFFVLKGHPNKLDIFINAPKEKRIERVMRKQGLSREEAIEAIETVDRGRENYVRRYTGESRYDARNYDLCINAGSLDEDQVVDLILDFIEKSNN